MAETADDGEEDIPGTRRYCTLADITLQRLKHLAKKGTHGRSVPMIMTNMIEQGVREAIKDGYLKLDDD